MAEPPTDIRGPRRGANVFVTAALLLTLSVLLLPASWLVALQRHGFDQRTRGEVITDWLVVGIPYVVLVTVFCSGSVRPFWTRRRGVMFLLAIAIAVSAAWINVKYEVGAG